jgi:nucleotide-sensitive chloride channel 1A
MQVATPGAPTEEDEEEGCVAFTVVLPADAPAQESTDAETETETPTQQLYGAVSACSYLHPDPAEDDSDDEDGPKFITAEEHEGVFQLGNGDLPPPVDGSSGWITAENMDQFFDADGNWIAGGEPPSFPLGPGAGSVRAREGENGAEENGEDETKWRKTD